jgi:hypothetical protein
VPVDVPLDHVAIIPRRPPPRCAFGKPVETGRLRASRVGRQVTRAECARLGQDRRVTSQPTGEAPGERRSPRRSVRQRLRARPEDLVDVFVYVVVLNLAVEYLPSVISESFSLSLLTALLLKIALEVVILLKGDIVAGLRAAGTRRAKAAIGFVLWVVVAGSKFVVLQLVDLVFGDAVSLGGFVSVTLLIAVLLISRAQVRRLLTSPPPIR